MATDIVQRFETAPSSRLARAWWPVLALLLLAGAWSAIVTGVTATSVAQDASQPSVAPAAPNLSPVPAPLGVPKAGPTNDLPYAPQPILPGGVVLALYPPDSPALKKERVSEAEQYNLSKAVPG